MKKCISGKKISEKIKISLKNKVSFFPRKIIFSIIYVGQDPVIDNFIEYKKKFGSDIGIDAIVHNFKTKISESELLDSIEKISRQSDTVIIQLPLPKHLDTQIILDAVPVRKDVDVLSTQAKKLFAEGCHTMMPPVTGALVESLKAINYSLDNKKILIMGYGDLVGKPFGSWLRLHGYTYTIVTKETGIEERNNLLKSADLIVSGVGYPNIIHANLISKDVVLLDAGTSEVGKKLIGDIDKNCYEKSSHYTPVPGGIGPITIAVLYQNILNSLEGK